MKTFILITLVATTLPFYSHAADCKITHYSQFTFENRVHSIPEMRDFSSTVNNLLKKSYNVLQKADEKTLGLVSAIASGGIPFDQLKPEQWDKLNITGNVVYQDMPFSGTPLKGVKVILSEKTNSRTITTGSYGEFSESFTKLVPYTRLRLFPIIAVNVGNKTVPTIKVPITIKIESKFCNAETVLNEIPLEPLIFILSKS
jgi:hypothetical protein